MNIVGTVIFFSALLCGIAGGMFHGVVSAATTLVSTCVCVWHFFFQCDHKINEVMVKKLNCIAETLATPLREAHITEDTPPTTTTSHCKHH